MRTSNESQQKPLTHHSGALHCCQKHLICISRYSDETHEIAESHNLQSCLNGASALQTTATVIGHEGTERVLWIAQRLLHALPGCQRHPAQSLKGSLSILATTWIPVSALGVITAP